MRLFRSSWPIRWCENTPPPLSAWAGRLIRLICWWQWRGHSEWGRNGHEPCQSRDVASISPYLYHSELPKGVRLSLNCRRGGCLWTPHRYRDRSRTQTHAKLQGWSNRMVGSSKTTHRNTCLPRGCYSKDPTVMQWNACAWRGANDALSVWRGRLARDEEGWPEIWWQTDSYYNQLIGNMVW